MKTTMDMFAQKSLIHPSFLNRRGSRSDQKIKPKREKDLIQMETDGQMDLGDQSDEEMTGKCKNSELWLMALAIWKLQISYFSVATT